MPLDIDHVFFKRSIEDIESIFSKASPKSRKIITDKIEEFKTTLKKL